MRLSKLVIFSFLLLNLPGLGQTPSSEGIDPLYAGLRGGYGFKYAHTDKISHLGQGHVPSLSLFFEKPAVLDSSWKSLYRDPHWGGGMYAADLANPEVLGWGAGGYVFMDLPLIGPRDGGLWGKVGSGLGVVQKRFEAPENLKNVAIGSHLNVFFLFQLSWKKWVGKRWVFSTGLGFAHFSNGAVRLPNMGINVPHADLSLAYRFTEPFNKEETAGERTIHRPVSPEDPNRFRLITGGGLKEVRPLLGKKFLAWDLIGEYDRRIGGKSYLGVGLDVFFDPSLEKKFREVGQEPEKPRDLFQVGSKLSYSLLYGNLTLFLQMGRYLYTAFHGDGWYYHRIGFRYQWSPRWLFNFSLKSHFADADHMEVGVGYIIPWGSGKMDK